MTSVLSLTTAGQTPAEWCSLAPTSGQWFSTSRIRVAPTTQVGYSHPSASTSQTRSGTVLISRVLVAIASVTPGSAAPCAAGETGSASAPQVRPAPPDGLLLRLRLQDVARVGPDAAPALPEDPHHRPHEQVEQPGEEPETGDHHQVRGAGGDVAARLVERGHDRSRDPVR